MSWTLRPGGPEDAEVISETLQLGFDGYRAFAEPGWMPPDARSALEVARVRARLVDPQTWALLAEDGGRPAGHAAYFPHAGVAGSAHLWQLFVRPPWWGSGLAGELLAAAVGAAVREGYDRMRFFTPRDQARARAFYEREGFRPTGWESYEDAIGLVLVEYAREALGERR